MESTSLFLKNINKLISIIDELRDCGIEGKISLPRICVMGTQSSGKSTLIESIVGLDFLPRGDGVCTRRPLELRLHHLFRKESEEVRPYAVFQDKSIEKIYDFEEVRRLIDQYTDQVAGQKKNIINAPITLSIYSTSCPDLTIIDLPGITKIPLKDSEQPENIQEITMNMTLNYINDHRTIILAVIPANIDLSTSEALTIAKQIDKEGKRTLGVITKIDLMDQGTSALKTLKNEEISLAHGFIGVKNRSQRDIKENKTVVQALKEEVDFFKNHSVYKKLSNCGTEFLSKKLSDLLLDTIKDQLPLIDKEIDDELKKVDLRICELGENIPYDKSELQTLIFNLIHKLTEKIFELLEERSHINSHSSAQLSEFKGYPLMNIYFNDISTNIQKQEREFMMNIKTHDIWLALMKFEGIKLSGFSHYEAFEFIIKRNFVNYAKICMESLEKVKLLLENIIDEAVELNFKNYSPLAKEMKQYTLDFLEKKYEISKKFITDYLEHETSFYYTTNPFYTHPRAEMREFNLNYDQAFIKKFGYPSNLDYQVEKTKNLEEAQAKERSEIDKIEQRLRITYDVKNKEQIEDFFWRLMCYVRIINRNIADSVPKAIISKLVISFKTSLNSNLIANLLANKSCLETLEEDKEVVEERSQMVNLMKKLKDAKKVFGKNIGKLKAS